MLARHRTDLATEEQAHAERSQAMLAEVTALELRRAKALAPVHLLETMADTRVREADDLLKQVVTREEYAEDLSELLQDKLDTVGAREQDVLAREQQVAAALANVRHQMQLADQNTATVNATMAEVIRTKADVEGKLQHREKSLDLLEQQLAIKADTLHKAEVSLQQYERKLLDDRATLDRAWQELERKRKAISP